VIDFIWVTSRQAACFKIEIRQSMALEAKISKYGDFLHLPENMAKA